MKSIYFDNAATTKIDDKVLEKMLPYLKENYGNASAIYKLGKESHIAIEEVRSFIAETFNCNKRWGYKWIFRRKTRNIRIKRKRSRRIYNLLVTTNGT